MRKIDYRKGAASHVPSDQHLPVPPPYTVHWAKGSITLTSSAFFHFFYVPILIYKNESSKSVLQSCLWSSIRKSDVRFSGLGVLYAAAPPNYISHFRQGFIIRLRVRSPENRLASKQWRWRGTWSKSQIHTVTGKVWEIFEDNTVMANRVCFWKG